MNNKDPWRQIADRMYVELVKAWCWHCGAERHRNNEVDEVLAIYRDAVDGADLSRYE